MLQIIITFLCFVLFIVSNCYSATYYADKSLSADCDGISTYYDPATRSCVSGSGTPGYDTMSECENACVASGDICYVMPGTYTSTIYSSVDGITIKGYYEDDRPVMDGSSFLYDAFNLEGDNVTIENFVIKDVSDLSECGIRGENALNLSISNIEIDNVGLIGDTTSYPISLNASIGTTTVDNVYIHGNTDNHVLIFMNGTGTVKITRSILNGEGVCEKAIYSGGGGAINKTIYNTIIHGYENYGILDVYSGLDSPAITLRNSVIFPNSAYDDTAYGVSIVDATAIVDIDNCLIMEGVHGYGNRAIYGGVQTIGDSMVNLAPDFVGMGKGLGIVTFTLDWDNYSAQVAKDLADVFNSRGLSMSMIVNRGFFSPSGTQDTADITYCQGKGMNIGSHGYSHSRIGTGIYDAISIQYVGAGSVCTLTISNNTLTTDTSGGGEDLNINLETYSNADTPSLLGQLISHINNKTDYTCVIVDNTVINGYAQATSLADVTAQDIATAAYTIVTDATRHFENEIVDNNVWVESVTGEDCRVFAYPGNMLSATSKTFIEGLDGISSGEKIEWVAGDDSSDNWDVESYEIIHGWRWSPLVELIDLASDDLRIRYFRDVGHDAVFNGKVLNIYFHADDFDPDSPTDGLTDSEKTLLGQCLDAIIGTGVYVLSMEQALDLVTGTNNGWTLNGSKYERSLTSTINFRPTAGSPLIDGGADVSLTSDTLGQKIPSCKAQDIGVYEAPWQSIGWFGWCGF